MINNSCHGSIWEWWCFPSSILHWPSLCWMLSFLFYLLFVVAIDWDSVQIIFIIFSNSLNWLLIEGDWQSALRWIAAPLWIGVYSKMTFKWHHASMFLYERTFTSFTLLWDKYNLSTTQELCRGILGNICSLLSCRISYILLNRSCRFKSVEHNSLQFFVEQDRLQPLHLDNES